VFDLAFLTFLENKLMKIVDILIILLMTSLVVLVFFQVINRFVLHIPAAWTEEIARYNFVWVSLYGSVKALKMGSHLSVDIIVETTKSEKVKKTIAFVGGVLVIVFSLILTVTGYQYMVANIGVDCEFGPFPLVIIYSAVPISGVLLILESILQMFKQMVGWKGEQQWN
jgi:TRAP-type C4-dicarboxylate transport system permease small subunit